jgi:6-hydroxytryprostatin B O-methyltransferase
VPLDGEVSYGELASKIGLGVSLVRRILRMATTTRIFREPRVGFVAHTANSAIFVRQPLMSALVGQNLDDVLPATVKMSEALQQYGDSEEPGEAALSLAFGIDPKGSYWRFLEEDGKGNRKGYRMERFSQAVAIASQSPGLHMTHVNHGFDWATLRDATVVDVLLFASLS